RGIIHFRAIEPCDRSAIQKLHQLWFPVDYTPEFFDMLCGCDDTTSSNSIAQQKSRQPPPPPPPPPIHSTATARAQNNITRNEAEDDDAGGESGELQRQRIRQKQQNQQKKKLRQPPPKMNSFYTCVACYKELNDDEFYNYQMLLLQRKRRRQTKISGGTKNDDAHVDADSEHFNDGIILGDEDWLLWESDDVNDDEYTKLGCMNRWRMVGGNSNQYEETTNSISDSSDAADDNDDDNIESGQSNTSILHRTERERMKRFYSNGCVHKWDGDEDGNTPMSSPPCYNEKGERIIGCIIGSFLPSQPQQQHRHGSSSSSSSFYAKSSEHKNQQHHQYPPPPSPPRDETAALLIPNPTIHRTMFYIMTLGTCQEFRRCGLGSRLVNRVVDVIQSQQQGELRMQQQSISKLSISDERRMDKGGCDGGDDGGDAERNKEEVGCCGALYLHVITYNKGAIRMYERLGFMRVKKIEDYYTINSVNYACYLYARYFHGTSNAMCLLLRSKELLQSISF
ncbi:hypothetical protein ACHAWU_004157, partial [Discostella pseudostelligera]